MTDGWYRIVSPLRGYRVQFVYQNHCELGSVHKLRHQDGCILEPVHVLSERELQEIVEHAVQERLQTPPVYGEKRGVEASNPHEWHYPTAAK